jgi:hypothetical protein
VFRLPVSDSLRKFDELEFVTKLRQGPDVGVVDLRRFTAEGTDEYSQRIRSDPRFHSVGFGEEVRLRVEQLVVREE